MYPKTERVQALFSGFGSVEVKSELETDIFNEHPYIMFALYQTQRNPITGSEPELITPWFRSMEDLEDFIRIHLHHYELIAFEWFFEADFVKRKGFKWFWL